MSENSFKIMPKTSTKLYVHELGFWTVSVPDGVFTKLLCPCNLFNAQLSSRPAHNNFSKVKKKRSL
jgi:hypothetical protein